MLISVYPLMIFQNMDMSYLISVITHLEINFLNNFSVGYLMLIYVHPKIIFLFQYIFNFNL